MTLCVILQNFLCSLKPLLRYGDLSIFKVAVVRHITSTMKSFVFVMEHIDMKFWHKNVNWCAFDL